MRHVCPLRGVAQRLLDARNDSVIAIVSGARVKVSTSRSWTPDFLKRSASSCIVGDVCSVGCLRDTRGFLDEFTALGCEMEPIRYGLDRSVRSAGAAGNGTDGVAQSEDGNPEADQTSPGGGTKLANQMAAQLDGVQRMIDALMPSVDTAVDELACTRNEKGHYCLLFTEDLNTMMVGA